MYGEVQLVLGAGCSTDSDAISSVLGWDVALPWGLLLDVAGVSADPAAEIATGKENGTNSSPSYGSGRDIARASCGGKVGVMIAAGKSRVLVGCGGYEAVK